MSYLILEMGIWYEGGSQSGEKAIRIIPNQYSIGLEVNSRKDP